MRRFAIRKLDRAEVAPLGNLIKADAFHVMAEARAALAQIEEQGRRAYERAVEQGKADGVAQGRQAVARLLTESAAAAQSYWATSERRLVAIVNDAVRRIVGNLDNDAAVAGMVERLVSEARDEGKIRLYVSPRQRPAIEKGILDFLKPSPGVATVEVVEDAGVEKDACRVETDLGIVETSVEAQIEALQSALAAYSAVGGPVVEE